MNPGALSRRHAASAAILGALEFAFGGCEQKPPSSASIIHADSLDAPRPTFAHSGTTVPVSPRVDTLLAQARGASESPTPPASADKAKPKAAVPQSPTGAGKPSASRPASDEELAERVKSALLAEPLSALAFNVSVSNGVVTLSGTADTQETRERAARIAAAVEGVKSVNNRINVVSGS